MTSLSAFELATARVEHDRTLMSLDELLLRSGWSGTSEGLPSGCDRIYKRGAQKYAVDVKSRTPSERTSPNITIDAAVFSRYASFFERTGTVLVIVSDDMMCDTYDFIVEHNKGYHYRDGYYWVSTKANPNGRTPMRFTVQNFFA